jgi:phage tail P2-like protein
MSELLPHNATDQESALADVMARLGEIQIPVRDIWRADTCPTGALAWLAWTFSVDQWDPAWSDDVKRATIKQAMAVQKIKGTPGAVRLALGALGIGARVLEWNQQEIPGDPFTYRLLLRAGANAASLEAINSAIAIVDRLKSLRSHLELVEITAAIEGGPRVAGFVSVGSEITVSLTPPPVPEPVTFALALTGQGADVALAIGANEALDLGDIS